MAIVGARRSLRAVIGAFGAGSAGRPAWGRARLARSARSAILLPAAAVLLFAPATKPLAAQDALAQQGLRPSVETAPGGYAPTRAPDIGLASAEPLPPRQTVTRDGDLTADEDAETGRDSLTATADGLFPPPDEPEGPIDGLDPQINDGRGFRDRQAFDYPDDFGETVEPREPDDALLFQVDDFAPFDPTLNRRPARLASLDPYTPIGIRIGTFVLFPEAEIAVTRHSNVFSSPDAEADVSGDLRPSLRLVSDWSNHALEFEATGDLSNYREFSTENDRGYELRARGRLDITRRANVSAALSRARAQEERSAVDASTVGERASVETNRFDSAAEIRFNRLSLQLRGRVEDTTYAEETTQEPVIRDRDSLERGGALRASWEFRPTFSVFGEVEGNDRAYEAASRTDGRLRNAHGLRLRTGLSFGETGEYLRGDVSVGYGRHDVVDERFEDAGSAIVDANLAWRVNALTSLLFTASSDFSTVTQTEGTGVAVTHRGGIEARHAFRRHLIGSAAIEGARRSYAGIDIDETEFVLNVGLEYYLRPEAVLFSKYEHTVFRSDFEGSDYESDEWRVGLRLRR